MHYSSLFLVLNKHYSSIFAFECKDVLPAPYHIVPTIWLMSGMGIFYHRILLLRYYFYSLAVTIWGTNWGT